MITGSLRTLLSGGPGRPRTDSTAVVAGSAERLYVQANNATLHDSVPLRWCISMNRNTRQLASDRGMSTCFIPVMDVIATTNENAVLNTLTTETI